MNVEILLIAYEETGCDMHSMVRTVFHFKHLHSTCNFLRFCSFLHLEYSFATLGTSAHSSPQCFHLILNVVTKLTVRELSSKHSSTYLSNHSSCLYSTVQYNDEATRLLLIYISCLSECVSIVENTKRLIDHQ